MTPLDAYQNNPTRLISMVGDQVILMKIYWTLPPMKKQIDTFTEMSCVEARIRKHYGNLFIYMHDLDDEENYKAVGLVQINPKKDVPWKKEKNPNQSSPL